jgi:hypothetical protein
MGIRERAEGAGGSRRELGVAAPEEQRWSADELEQEGAPAMARGLGELEAARHGERGREKKGGSRPWEQKIPGRGKLEIKLSRSGKIKEEKNQRRYFFLIRSSAAA